MGILFMKVFKSLLKFLIFIRFSELGWKLAFIHFIVINGPRKGEMAKTQAENLIFLRCLHIIFKVCNSLIVVVCIRHVTGFSTGSLKVHTFNSFLHSIQVNPNMFFVESAVC